MKKILVVVSILFIFSCTPYSSYASTKSYLITDGFENTYPYTNGYVFLYKNTFMNYQSGDVVLSSTPDGRGKVNIGDVVRFSVQNTDVSLPIYFTHYGEEGCLIFHPTSPPLNITHLFNRGKQHNAGISLMNWCDTKKTITPLYIVNTNIKDTPDPAPFLDLPWDYKSKKMSFVDAALSMTSYFDHEYPLLSSGLKEDVANQNSVISYKDKNRNYDLDYSSHDGYDYSGIAQVHMHDPVLSSAEGYAQYINSCPACGNMIVIDHQNGYQSRYLHMQKDGLIISTPNQTVWVNKRQIIGKVGATGNVWPQGDQGAHIHFGLVYDKNHDGNFDDNISDGMVDPFGWQSKEQDPWEAYSSSKSYYLWTNELFKTSTTIGKSGGLFGFPNGRYSISFPEGAVSQDLIISLSVEPVNYEESGKLRPIGAGIVITVTDLLGNIISSLLKNFTIKMVYQGLDTTDVDTDSIAIYSSQDGINWNKEITQIDTSNNILSAQLNHLTHFAIMAERKDITAPTTESVLTGSKEISNSYISPVILTLMPKDNEGGLGIDYTMVKKDADDWNVYTTPLAFTDEGVHIVSYYSVDKGWNVEKIYTITFTIAYPISSSPTPISTPTPTPNPTIIQPDMVVTSTPSSTTTNTNNVSKEVISPIENVPKTRVKPTSFIVQRNNKVQDKITSSSGAILGVEETSKQNNNKKKHDDRLIFFLLGLCMISMIVVYVRKRTVYSLRSK